MNDSRSMYQIAIDLAKKDYDFYSRRHDERKVRAAEMTLKALNKSEILIYPKGMFKDRECPMCGSEEECGLYCSECGQRINEERVVEDNIKQNEMKIKFANEILEFCKAGDYNCDLLEATEMLYTELFVVDDAELNVNKLVQVCSSCKRACCWCGEFMCEDNFSAGTELKTVKELRELNKHENEDYWGGEYMRKVYGDPNPFGVIESEVKR